jgi:hypothetical protein
MKQLWPSMVKRYISPIAKSVKQKPVLRAQYNNLSACKDIHWLLSCWYNNQAAFFIDS